VLTEPGFSGKLKAILARFQQILQVGMRARTDSECGTGMEAKYPRRQNPGHLLEAFRRRQQLGFIMRAHALLSSP
jgi:hypothetical protein